MWWIPFNAVLGGLVVTIGLWLIWGQLPAATMALMGLAVAGVLVWRSSTAGAVWAWSTLLLGLESVAWPIATMVQVRLANTEPTDEQMGLMLTAILYGLFSAIFWLTFSYGIFKWIKRDTGEPAHTEQASEPMSHRHGRSSRHK
jgi:hypothetical protein